MTALKSLLPYARDTLRYTLLVMHYFELNQFYYHRNTEFSYHYHLYTLEYTLLIYERALAHQLGIKIQA